MRRTIESLLLTSLVAAVPALARSVFIIADPPVDFEVVDVDPFDGLGDEGPFSTFNDAALGTEGECRSMAEFDILPFTVPAGEYISSARLEVRITSVGVYGLGIHGEAPDSLAVDGYIANGIAELSDFQAGDGNQLDLVPIPNPYVGQIVTFQVTPFVRAMVQAHRRYVGLTVRAATFGGVWVTEGAGYPKLTIETTAFSAGDLNCDTLLNAFDIDPFVLALSDPAAYAAQYPNCNRMLADCNGDGQVNAFDIDPFVELLTGP